MPMAAFDRLGAMSRNNDHPETACRPFDKNRDGLVMGEGAATLILEDLEFAQARGAQILAEIVGYGCTSDAFHVTAPAENGVGAAKAMQRALRDAGSDTAGHRLDQRARHGHADLNDKFETAAIKSVFGEHAYRVPISGTKGDDGPHDGGHRRAGSDLRPQSDRDRLDSAHHQSTKRPIPNAIWTTCPIKRGKSP